MKQFILIVASLFWISIFGIGQVKYSKSKSANETIILGTIISTNHVLDGAFIELREDTTVIQKCIVNQEGKFILRTKTDKKIDLYFSAIYGEGYIQTVSEGGKDTILVAIEFPKKYKKRFGKVFCPKCAKQDMTIPIKYGFGGRRRYKKYYDAGTCVSSEISPRWYCKRDKLEF